MPAVSGVRPRGRWTVAAGEPAGDAISRNAIRRWTHRRAGHVVRGGRRVGAGAALTGGRAGAAGAGPDRRRPGARARPATPSTAPCTGASGSSRSDSRRARRARGTGESPSTPRSAGEVRNGRPRPATGRRRARPDRRACPAAPRRHCGAPAPGSCPLLSSPLRKSGRFVQHGRELTDLARRHPRRLARWPADHDLIAVDEHGHAPVAADHVAARDAPDDVTVLHLTDDVTGAGPCPWRPGACRRGGPAGRSGVWGRASARQRVHPARPGTNGARTPGCRTADQVH